MEVVYSKPCLRMREKVKNMDNCKKVVNFTTIIGMVKLTSLTYGQFNHLSGVKLTNLFFLYVIRSLKNKKNISKDI
jgi:Ca2+/Na+ antiporter